MTTTESTRTNCPQQNIGRAFGSIDDAILEGSVLEPNYCIVSYGKCSVHGQCDDHTKQVTCHFCHTPQARKFPVKA